MPALPRCSMTSDLPPVVSLFGRLMWLMQEASHNGAIDRGYQHGAALNIMAATRRCQLMVHIGLSFNSSPPPAFN